jgi:signal transduction histidine kinase
MTDTAAKTSPETKAPRREAWERWVTVWIIVFYISVGIPMVLALLAEESNQERLLILGLSLGLGAWYALVMMWILPRARDRWRVIWPVIFLIGAILLWFPLARTHWAYFITASAFYGLMWGTLPFGFAVAGNVILTGLLIWVQALNMGRAIEISLTMLLIWSVVIGWSALLALWIRTIMRESSKRKQLIEQLEAAQDELATVEREAGMLEERQRMAQEIHDTLAQGFTSIILQLEGADQALPEDLASVEDRIHKARDTARNNLEEARRLVLALQPEPLQQRSLVEALRRETEKWERNSGVRTSFSVTGDPKTLHPQCEVTLLRALQEGLNNVLKHAQAEEVNITLSYMTDQIALDIHDNGQGFDPLNQDASIGNGGFGLQTMRQRAEQSGGLVLVESAEGKGTTLVVQIPLDEALDGAEVDGRHPSDGQSLDEGE